MAGAFPLALGRVERRGWAPLYLHGLLSPAPRKNVEQIAEYVARSEIQQLHHFVSTSPWWIASLGEDVFEEISWRDGTQRPLRARFAATRVKAVEGPRVEGKALPGEEVLWLVCDWRNTGEKKYYLCNHAPNTSLKTLARHIKARWSCEQAHEQLKNQLGLDHLGCRSWRALHHHALLLMIAFCFLQGLRRPGEKETRYTAVLAPQRTAAKPLASRGAAPLAPGPRARVHAPVPNLR